MSQLDLYNLNPFSIPTAKPDDIGFFEGVGIGAKEALPDLSYNLASDAFSYQTGEPTINEEEWRQSPYWRKSLKYHPNLNWDWAKALAERHDDNAEFSRLHSRMGMGAEIGSFVGSLGTGLIDPINWIALPATFTANLVRQTGSRLIASALHGAASNIAVEAALSPLQAASAEAMQEKYGFSEFVQQAGASGTLGLLFGGAGNLLSTRIRNRRAQRQQQTDMEQPLEQPFDQTAETQTAQRGFVDDPNVETPTSVLDEQGLTEQRQSPEARQDLEPEIQDELPVFENIEQQTDAEIATTANALIKAAQTDSGKRNVILTLAQKVTRERFVQLSQIVRNKRKDRKIASRYYREIYEELAGEKPSNKLLSLDTKVGAIWDKVNDEKSIIDADVLLDTVDSEYVRVLETREGIPNNVSEDKFVVFDVLGFDDKPSLEGTRIGLARAKNEIADFLIRNRNLTQVEVRLQDDGSKRLIKIDDLMEYLDELRSETGIDRIAAVLDGETVADVDMPERFRESQYDTLENAWTEIKHLYGDTPIEQITDAADEFVAAVNTPEDMAEMIQNLRMQVGPDDVTAKLLDDAEMLTNDLTAQREALREAYMCLLS
ncbi:hypothetical protein N8000_07360 [Rhodospirillales bacterium]|nr:hypothetical protein [Rhodospirillales bacterium]